MKMDYKRLSFSALFATVLAFFAMERAAGQTLTNNLRGYWPLDETSGVVVTDRSGGFAPGELRNAGAGNVGGVNDASPWVNDTVRGATLQLSNVVTGAYVYLGNLPVTMTTDNSFTWSFWAKSFGAAGANTILGNRLSSDGVDFIPAEWIRFTSAQFEYQANNVAYNPNYADLANETVWQHHAIVKEGPVLRYYRNGVLDAATATIGFRQVNLSMPLYIGTGAPNTVGARTTPWAGAIDEIAIWDRALSATEVTSVNALGAANIQLMPTAVGASRVISRSPASNATAVPFNTKITQQFYRGTNNITNIQIRLNNTLLTSVLTTNPISANAGVIIAEATPASFPASGSTNTVSVTWIAAGVTNVAPNYTFVVQTYVSIPATWRVTNVDTAKAGALVRVNQSTSRRSILGARGDFAALAEKQLAGRGLANLVPLATFATSSGLGAYAISSGTLNFNADAITGADEGNLTTAAGNTTVVNGFTDVRLPGIPNAAPFLGTINVDQDGDDNIAVEIQAFLSLPAGPVTLGVNSPGGYRLTMSPIGALGDAFGTELIGKDRQAGGATTANFVVATAGMYAVRLVGYNANGDQNLEFYSVNANGSLLAINDTALGGIAAYYGRTGTAVDPAHVEMVDPYPNPSLATTALVWPDEPIHIELIDGATAVDTTSITLSTGGTARTVSSVKTGTITRIDLAAGGTNGVANGAWPSGNLAISLVWRAGTGSTAVTTTNNFTVTVLPYVTLSACLQTAIGSVAAAGGLGSPSATQGMTWRTFQAATNTTTILNNYLNTASPSNAELLLRGQALPSGVIAANAASANTALITGFDNYQEQSTAGGASRTWRIEYVNMTDANAGANPAANGVFADGRVAGTTTRNTYEWNIPGIPGTGANANDYIVGEATTFIPFATPGVYAMGVNRIGAFQLAAATTEGGRQNGGATAPYATNSPNLQVIGTGGNLAAADANNPQSLMVVRVETAGVWPFRLLWWHDQAANGHVEWYQTTKTDYVGLINDIDQNTASLRAFASRTALPALPSAAVCALPQGTITSVVRSGNSFTINFTGTLSSATTPNGPWPGTAVTGSGSVTITPAAGAPVLFYRAGP